MDFIDVAMVFIKFCMCSLILAWFSKVYLGIHDVHKSNCKYLAVNPYIYIYLSIYIIPLVNNVNIVHLYLYKNVCIQNYMYK